jgi:hypothetical protein
MSDANQNGASVVIRMTGAAPATNNAKPTIRPVSLQELLDMEFGPDGLPILKPRP